MGLLVLGTLGRGSCGRLDRYIYIQLQCLRYRNVLIWQAPGTAVLGLSRGIRA